MSQRKGCGCRKGSSALEPCVNHGSSALEPCRRDLSGTTLEAVDIDVLFVPGKSRFERSGQGVPCWSFAIYVYPAVGMDEGGKETFAAFEAAKAGVHKKYISRVSLETFKLKIVFQFAGRELQSRWDLAEGCIEHILRRPSHACYEYAHLFCTSTKLRHTHIKH